MRLVIDPAFYKALNKLDRPRRERVKEAVFSLREQPYPRGVKQLKGTSDEFFRLRVGDYRVMYEVVGDEVRVIDLVHRRDLERWIRRL